MGEVNQSLCFTCGLPSSSSLQLNRLPNGSVCPACRDRLLDSIAPALPRRGHDSVPEMGAGSALHEEIQSESERDGDSRPWPPPGMAS